MAPHETGNRIHLANARRHTRNAAVATIIAFWLTGCMFGDETSRTAQTGVAAAFTDCVPAECFYGCCQGPAAQLPPQLIGAENPWKARCEKLATSNAKYKEYVNDLFSVDLNYCDNELGYEWGPCTPIPADAVVKIGPNGAEVPAGLHFNECPPSGDWMAYPFDENEIDIVPREP
jgi:hypothetical protein